MTPTRTMRAFQIPGWGQPARFEDVPVPSPGEGEILVKVAGVGLCHSDIAMQSMTEEQCSGWGWTVPFTLGHETAGHVAEVGRGVDRTKVGDPVALMTSGSCGECAYCLEGQDINCINASAGRGFGRDGGLAEYVLVDSERAILPLPPSLDPATIGPLTDAGSTSMHAVKRVLPRLRPGSVAVVIGVGGLGGFAVQFLRVLSGATVIAVDPNPARLEIALELGAHHAVPGIGDGTVEALREFGDGLGATAVLAFAGFDDSITAGIAAVRRGGAYGLIGAGFGTLAGPWYGSLPFDGEVFTFQGGAIADTRDVLKLAEQGAITNPVEVFSFDDVAEAYRRLDEGSLRGRAVISM